VIASFKDRATEDIFNGLDTKLARRACPRQLWPAARRRLDALNNAAALSDLQHLGLEKLKGDRLGQHSIRINEQFRVCFVWTPQGPANVEIVDYHSAVRRP